MHAARLVVRARATLAASISLVTLAALGVACGSEPPPRAPEPAPEPPPAPRPHKGPSMSQELGSIDEAATKKTFVQLQSQLGACHTEGLKRIEYLAGDVKFFLRIGQDGRVRYAYLEESTMGDRDTEKCQLDVLTAAQWPRPEEGEAEVRNGMGFDSPSRPPTDWPSDKIALVLAKQADEALKCKEGAKGTFHVTAYVAPGPPRSHEKAAHAKAPHARSAHGGNNGAGEGHVTAVGVAVPGKDGEAKVDCIVSAVKEWHMPSPGSYAAKVSFNL
jgi:hypothetical protein